MGVVERVRFEGQELFREWEARGERRMRKRMVSERHEIVCIDRRDIGMVEWVGRAVRFQDCALNVHREVRF